MCMVVGKTSLPSRSVKVVWLAFVGHCLLMVSRLGLLKHQTPNLPTM